MILMMSMHPPLGCSKHNFTTLYIPLQTLYIPLQTLYIPLQTVYSVSNTIFRCKLSIFRCKLCVFRCKLCIFCNILLIALWKNVIWHYISIVVDSKLYPPNLHNSWEFSNHENWNFRFCITICRSLRLQFGLDRNESIQVSQHLTCETITLHGSNDCLLLLPT